MKKIMSFDMDKPEDRDDFKVYNNAFVYLNALQEVDQKARGMLKYDEKLSKQTVETLEMIRTIIYEELKDASLYL